MLSTRSNVYVSRKKCEHWFREWIIGKQTFRQLVFKSGYNERTLKRYFYEQLSRYPEWQIVRREQVNLLIDGTYFSNNLDNPRIPKTTNGLESFFGHLKQNISLHRGLSKEHYKNYLKWYIYYKSNE